MCIMLCWMVEHDDYIFRKVTLFEVRGAGACEGLSHFVLGAPLDSSKSSCGGAC